MKSACKVSIGLASGHSGVDTTCMSDPPNPAPSGVLQSRTGGRMVARIAILLAICLFAGCRPSTPPQNGRTGAADLGQSATGDPIGTEPCAARLQEISGQLLLYYVAKRKLPESLDELRSYADVDQTPDYTCPVSHQPYTYTPNGLEGPQAGRRVIVYDSSPVHHNARWCITMVPAHGKQPLMMEVVQIPELVFGTLRPVPAPPPIAPATAPAPGPSGA